MLCLRAHFACPLQVQAFLLYGILKFEHTFDTPSRVFHEIRQLVSWGTPSVFRATSLVLATFEAYFPRAGA
ncbi:hypothetical protein K443DRAFT_684594 [Laccaria amethystina LaAM-08-1]|uniref:Uncharacterized protein n=1 Tax=Laccaria amethystina LaAM-08-1 TaxID=1095629 RepID=A0A0C9X6S6_9AGAR|nr:hypothetical protein K443DRAFT_684594 [Laccaria amethystina LaAM-08-1]